MTATIPPFVLLLSDKSLLRQAILLFKARKIDSFTGHYPLYSFELPVDEKKSITVGLQCFYYGSSSAAVAMEELVKKGVKRVLLVGRAHPVSKLLSEGMVLIPSRAIRDEGPSFHYLEPSQEVFGSLNLSKAAKVAFESQGIDAMVGCTWTTDVSVSVALSTKDIKDSNCEAVDFETASLLAVSDFHDVEFLPILIIEHMNLTKKIKKLLKGKAENNFRKGVLQTSALILATNDVWKFYKEDDQQRGNPKLNLVPKIEKLLEELHERLAHHGQHLTERQALLVHALKEKTVLFESEFKRLQQEKHTFLSNSSGQRILKDVYKILQQVRDALEDVLSEVDSKKEEKLDSSNAIQEMDEAIESVKVPITPQPEVLAVKEPAKNLQINSHQLTVYLVNLPRRFRYKPEYKRYFSGEHEVKTLNV